MGIEYRLEFTHSGVESVASILRPLPMAQETSPSEGRFDLRGDPSPSEMPDASLRVEPHGLYYCDNGGRGRQLLGVVVARLVSEFGSVTVSHGE